ncbi:MAG: serine/threonine-protein phosphatase [Nocardioides sp.]|nr:serine/threonine-protein phosphatase [Nocardioides sp.]
MSTSLLEVLQRVSAFFQGRVDSWRTGSTGSQMTVLAMLLGLVAATFAASWFSQDMVSLSLWFLWLVLGMLVLRFVPMLVLCGAVLAAAVVVTTHFEGERPAFPTGLVTLVSAMAVILFHSSRQRSGLPVALSEPLLVQLRDRLQGEMPDLPPQWHAESGLLTAHGTSYAGDFLVADVQEGRWLELVLVDVCGKGVAVGAQALQFSGALGGLLGALPPGDLMQAANAFLLRQGSDDSFATAVHLLLDLETGEYMISNAGHPPALHWRAQPGGWFTDEAQGMALGVVAKPELEPSRGQLAPGEALMFYTDGVVESRGRDLDEGIEWLRDVALSAVLARGFPGAARRILRRVPRGADDRALLILQRLPQ